LPEVEHTITLIKDLIPIPERVHQGDFVLRLSEGVQHAEQTLRDYVVTPQLAAAFENALSFIKSSATRSGSTSPSKRSGKRSGPSRPRRTSSGGTPGSTGSRT
jgi:hypothetical protein